ncbi:hypothetical protein PENSUB_10548 [Penicillium subrubescens]|uniref:Uncharacterized protein n=1 Tax=Penicillium subrubescens TaxID=1316194 RepID=A0A1Q5T822_9EURO|nr:hypothetical protein PENSUB_10548 [Penicillium subrubescens]
MSAPGGAPSPAPRGGSMGPGANGGNMPMSSQQPMSGTPIHSAPPPGPPPPQSGAIVGHDDEDYDEEPTRDRLFYLPSEYSRYIYACATRRQQSAISLSSNQQAVATSKAERSAFFPE